MAAMTTVIHTYNKFILVLHTTDCICPAILKTVCGMLRTINMITILGFYFTKNKINKKIQKLI